MITSPHHLPASQRFQSYRGSVREQPEARLHPPSQVSGLRSDPTSLACPHSSEGHLKTNRLHQPKRCAQWPHGIRHQVVNGPGRGVRSMEAACLSPPVLSSLASTPQIPPSSGLNCSLCISSPRCVGSCQLINLTGHQPSPHAPPSQ